MVRGILLALCALVAVCIGQVHAAGDYNVLFIIVDDLRPEIRAYDQPLAITPNIDRIAARGTKFTNAYCQVAACHPSRTSFLTGLRPDTTGVVDERVNFRDTVPDAVTLPEYFKNQGYISAGVGKVFHSPALNDTRSWNQFFTTGNSMPLYATSGVPNIGGPSVENVTADDAAYRDGARTDMVVSLIDSFGAAPSPKPFFFAIGLEKPHLPFAVPTPYWNKFNRSQFIPSTLLQFPANSPSVARLAPAWQIGEYSDITIPVSNEKAQELIHGYYAATSYIDAQIGKLLRALDRNRLTNETIIVLTSDHGFQLGEYNLWTKFTNYEWATRVPMIIFVPGRTSGKTSTALVELIDLYPTLCQLNGLPVPAACEGLSFASVVINPSRTHRDMALSQIPRDQSQSTQRAMGYTVRTSRFRYTKWYDRDTMLPLVPLAHELYDHEADSDETVSYADDPNYATFVTDLDARLSGLLRLGQ